MYVVDYNALKRMVKAWKQPIFDVVNLMFQFSSGL